MAASFADRTCVRKARTGGAVEQTATDVFPIDDPDDTRLDPYRSLRARESGDVLWAEGPTVVERLCTSGLTVRSFLLTPAAHERLAPAVAASAAPVYVVSQQVLNRVVGFDLHRGAIAVADRPHLPPLEEAMAALAAAATVVVLEGVNDPENLGAIARSARALGAGLVLLDPTCADPYYRRTVRVSMGEILHLPVVRTDLPAAFQALADAGFATWALTPWAAADDIGALAPPPRLALVAGAEGPGLSEQVLGAHRNVRIPIHGGVDSLNVGHAIAAALAVVQSSRS
jgi:tRNA G18 (ribose-2'-O)-methylase SpoU